MKSRGAKVPLPLPEGGSLKPRAQQLTSLARCLRHRCWRLPLSCRAPHEPHGEATEAWCNGGVFTWGHGGQGRLGLGSTGAVGLKLWRHTASFTQFDVIDALVGFVARKSTAPCRGAGADTLLAWKSLGLCATRRFCCHFLKESYRCLQALRSWSIGGRGRIEGLK